MKAETQLGIIFSILLFFSLSTVSFRFLFSSFRHFFFLAASCSFIKIVFAPSLRFLFIALVQEIRKRDSFYGRFFLALVFSFVFCAFDDVVFWQSFTNCGGFFFGLNSSRREHHHHCRRRSAFSSFIFFSFFFHFHCFILLSFVVVVAHKSVYKTTYYKFAWLHKNKVHRMVLCDSRELIAVKMPSQNDEKNEHQT